jgi:hypothetical protein
MASGKKAGHGDFFEMCWWSPELQCRGVGSPDVGTFSAYFALDWLNLKIPLNMTQFVKLWSPM